MTESYLKSSGVQIFVEGKLLETVGEPQLHFAAAPDDFDIAAAEFTEREFSFEAKIEPAMPPDIEKLRSVSPAAKKVFARDRMKRSIEAWLLKVAGVANENR